MSPVQVFSTAVHMLSAIFRHGKVKQVEADVIFGNDGAHSVVRKEIMKRTR
jgi:2-polyprenyl-6-methoxyphenol hydroxylase-like FAD-dependent oxidoreductase